MKLKNVLALGLLAGGAYCYYFNKTNKADTTNKSVLITGASTGIGKDIAEKLALEGYKVYGTVRKEKDAEALKEISENIIPVIMDVSKHETIVKAYEFVKQELGENKLYALINNAGIAVAGPLELIPIEELRKQFDVNYFGVIDTTQVFFDLLDKENSKIVNMSSVGGKVASPFLGPYSSSKFALEAMSDSLRREIGHTNIEVILIEPGRIVTPIWDKADDLDVELYKGTDYEDVLEKVKTLAVEGGKQGASVDLVSKTVSDVLKRKYNKARYWVSGSPLAEVFIPRMLPDKVLDKVVNFAMKR